MKTQADNKNKAGRGHIYTSITQTIGDTRLCGWNG